MVFHVTLQRQLVHVFIFIFCTFGRKKVPVLCFFQLMAQPETKWGLRSQALTTVSLATSWLKFQGGSVSLLGRMSYRCCTASPVTSANDTCRSSKLEIWPQRPMYFAATHHSKQGGGGTFHGGVSKGLGVVNSNYS